MREADYSKNYRRSVLQQALAIYNRKVEEEKNAERPIYRPKSWQKEERKKMKEEEKHQWSTKGGFVAPIFVPASQGDRLARRTNKVVEEERKGEIYFKIVEMGGERLKNELQKSNPTATPGYEKDDCIGCKKERRGEGQCARNDVNYEIECRLCSETNPIGRDTNRKNRYKKFSNNLEMFCQLNKFH